MDLGFFAKSKLRFRMFILLPVIVPAAVMLGAAVYSNHANQAQAVRQSLLDHLPGLERNLERAEQIVADYQPLPGAGTADPAELVRQFLNTSADDAGFVINSMSVQDARDFKGDIQRRDATLIIELAGEGDTAAVIRFASALQAFKGLIVIERTRVFSDTARTDREYSASFIISYYALGRARAANG